MLQSASSLLRADCEYTALRKKSGSVKALFPHPQRNQIKSWHCIFRVNTDLRL